VVYLAGLHGVNQSGVTALDSSPASANCVHWTQSLPHGWGVNAMALGGDVLYLGGGGQNWDDGAMALDTDDGAITSWNPGLRRTTSSGALGGAGNCV